MTPMPAADVEEAVLLDHGFPITIGMTDIYRNGDGRTASNAGDFVCGETEELENLDSPAIAEDIIAPGDWVKTQLIEYEENDYDANGNGADDRDDGENGAHGRNVMNAVNFVCGEAKELEIPKNPTIAEDIIAPCDWGKTQLIEYEENDDDSDAICGDDCNDNENSAHGRNAEDTVDFVCGEANELENPKDCSIAEDIIAPGDWGKTQLIEYEENDDDANGHDGDDCNVNENSAHGRNTRNAVDFVCREAKELENPVNPTMAEEIAPGGDWGKTQLIEYEENDDDAHEYNPHGYSEEATEILSANGDSDDDATTLGRFNLQIQDAQFQNGQCVSGETLKLEDDVEETLIETDSPTVDGEEDNGAGHRNNADGRRHDLQTDEVEHGGANSEVIKLFENTTLEKDASNDGCLAGLSYTKSQEPGDMSQANAMETIDRIITINDVTFSQDINTDQAEVVRSPVLSKNGLMLLSDKFLNRSNVKCAAEFDWRDSQEDEGGGEMFCRKKEFFLKRKGTGKKPQYNPPTHGGSVILSSSTADYKACDTTTREVPCSDSRLVPLYGIIATTDGMNSSKDLHDVVDLPPAELMEQQKVNLCFNSSSVGPDTQMAAEAMEVLFCSSGKAELRETECRLVGSESKEDNSKGVPCSDSRLVPLSGMVESTDVVNSSKDLHDIVDVPPAELMEQQKVNLCFNNYSVSPDTQMAAEPMEVLLCSSEKPESGETESHLVGSRSKEGNSKGVKVSTQKRVRRTSCLELGALDGSPVKLTTAKSPFQKKFVKSTPVKSKRKMTKSLLAKHETPQKTEDENSRNACFSPIACRTRSSAKNTVPEGTDLSSNIFVRTKRLGILGDNIKQADVTNFLSPQCPKSHGLNLDIATHPKRRRTLHTISNASSGPSRLSGERSELLTKPENCAKRKRVFIRSASELLKKALGEKRTIPMTTEHQDGSSLTPSKQKPLVDGGFTKKSFASYGTLPKRTDSGHLSAIKATRRHPGGKSSVESRKDSSEYKAQSAGGELNDVSPSPACKLAVVSNTGFCRASSVRELLSLDLSALATQQNSRRRKDMSSVRVLFSNHLDDFAMRQQQKILARFGISEVTRVSDATHFVADRFVRTKNMLEAMALGKPIVTPLWLESCGQTNYFIDEKKYILRDEKKEKEIGFHMLDSLASAREHPLLQGKKVYITPNVKPTREIVARLVVACSGQMLDKITRSKRGKQEVPENLLVLTAEEDHEACAHFLDRGVKVFSSELLLNGIVIQKLEYDRHQVFCS